LKKRKAAMRRGIRPGFSILFQIGFLPIFVDCFVKLITFSQNIRPCKTYPD
jgi:hypothetical protein